MALALDLNLFNNDLIISSGEKVAEMINSLFNNGEACITQTLDNTAELMANDLSIDEVMSNVTSWVTNAGNMEFEASTPDRTLNANDIMLCFSY